MKTNKYSYPKQSLSPNGGGHLSNLIFGVLFSIGIVFVVMIFTCPRCFTNGTLAMQQISISFLYGLGLYLGMSYLNNYLTPRVPWIKKPWTSFFTVLILNCITVVVVIGIATMIWRAALLQETPFEAIAAIRLHDISIPLVIGLLITSVFIGASFLGTWKKSLLETEHFKQAQLAAKYETLNSQVNPHFLFNSLNVLSSLVKKDATRAEGFIHDLSEVYRYVLDIQKEELVTLEKELKALNSYENLLQTRFGDRLQLQISVAKRDDIYIVPLSLQMLLENAVKHNAATSKNPLRIAIYEAEGKIWVANKKQALNEKVYGKKMGLENIKERYELASGKDIIVVDTNDEFKVGLPIITD